MMVEYIRRPPNTDMAAAPPAICDECQRTVGRAMPMTTKKPVRNLPKSTTPFPWLSIKSSWFAALPHSQFGNGAITYVATTRRVR